MYYVNYGKTIKEAQLKEFEIYLILKPLRVKSRPTLQLQLTIFVFIELVVLSRSVDFIFHDGNHVLAQRSGRGGGREPRERRVQRRSFAVDFYGCEIQLHNERIIGEETMLHYRQLSIAKRLVISQVQNDN